MFLLLPSLSGPVQVLLRGGAWVLELWVTQSSWTQQRLNVWDFTEDCSSHVCDVLRVWHTHTHSSSDLTSALLVLLLVWLEGKGKVTELYSVSYPSEGTQQEHKEVGFFFFLCSESPPLLQIHLSLPLSLSAACSPVVVALILIGHFSVFGMRFTVHNVTC